MKQTNVYSASADIYDHMMKDVDYLGWSDYILDLSYEFGFDVSSVLDISCGTGTLLNHFPCKNKKGTDISEAMIKKASKNYPYINFSTADMQTPDLHGGNCILNIHDALNYLHSIDKIKDHLEFMRKHCNDNQTYIFDFAMKNVLRNHFEGVKQTGKTQEGIRYIRHNRYSGDGNYFLTSINISYPDGKKLEEIHSQRIYSFREIKNLCMEIDPNRFIFLEEFTFQPANHESERLLVLML